MIARCLFFISLCIAPLSLHAQILAPETVLQASREHFPEILAQREQVNTEAGRVTEAEGAFDATLEQQLYTRPTGGYSGQQTDTRVVKPFQDFNARVFGGYRQSAGNFPIYEDERITNDDGEILFGVELSLLRDRLIDDRRANLYDAQLDREIAEVDLLLKQVAVQHDALFRYWQWAATGYAKRVLAELLSLAEDRQSGLQKRNARGDVADITLTENQQNILRRRAQLNDAQLDFELAANELALYLRNADGETVAPSPEQLPSVFPAIQGDMEEGYAIEKLSERPEFQRIARRLKQLENAEAIGENRLLPKADLSVEFSDDFGAGDDIRADGETVIKLGISIPLERRFGEGKVAQARAQQRQLELEQRLLNDKLVLQLKNAFASLETAREFVKISKEEASLARKLREAEVTRFENGRSDFFLLNIREERMAEAQIKLVQAQQRYRLALTKLYALTLDKEALGLS